MENSAADRTAVDPPAEEESGWTAYLEDFSCGGSHVSSPSLVSDAAWNGTDCLVRRLDFKKMKRNIPRKWSYDDDLEDTASSPVNSPKVSNMEVNYKRTDDVASNNFLEKQAVSNNFWKHDREERSSGKNIIESKNTDQYDELRKRGLCLVPMATLMHYIG